MIAALYVDPKGCYSGLEGVELWDEGRDARLYAGPWPVVAHPPCARWGRYWSGGPMLAHTPKRKKLGDDGGCFAAALAAVRKYGGVLGHPEASHAWRVFGLNTPPRTGAWVNADFLGGWTCCVEQGHFGHKSRKATWLYVFGSRELVSFEWRKSAAGFKMDDGYHSKEERRKAQKLGTLSRLSRLSRRERIATPEAFRDVLLSIAKGVKA